MKRTDLFLLSFWLATAVVFSLLCLQACGAMRPPGAVPPSDRGGKRAPVPDTGQVAALVSARIGRPVPELPALADTTFLIINPAGRYVLLYDTLQRQAAWVAYLLTRAEVEEKGVERAGRFVPDPQVVARGWPTARDADYRGTPYDRGHLLPSADRNGTKAENGATFLFSNVAPQLPALNRRIWKNLEEQVRRWAAQYDSLYIVTGGVFRGPDGTQGTAAVIGKDGVGIPTGFYKALLVRIDGRWRCAAFLIPHDAEIPGTWRDYLILIAELEVRTGINFFHQLPAPVQRNIESAADPDFWR